MKKLIALGLIACMSTTALADDFHLYIVDSSNTKTSYNVDNIQKITFENDQVVITSDGGSTAQINISAINQMYLDTPLSDGIETNRADGNAYPTWAEDCITIHGSFARVRIYNANGQSIAELNSDSQLRLSTATWASGLYIVSIDGKSYKIVKH